MLRSPAERSLTDVLQYRGRIVPIVEEVTAEITLINFLRRLYGYISLVEAAFTIHIVGVTGDLRTALSMGGVKCGMRCWGVHGVTEVSDS